MIEILRTTVRVAAAAVLVLGAVHSADAAFVVKFDTNYGSDDPSGTGPWLTATFADVEPGKVRLSLQANLQSTSEFITAIGFNGPTGLSAQHESGPLYASFNASGADSQLNGGGAPSFNFGFNFPTSNAPGTDRLNGTDLVTILLTKTGLDATDFNVAVNGFFAGARVQGISGGGSAKLKGPGEQTPSDDTPPGNIPGVPEPGTLALLALGSIGLGGYRKLRSRKEIAA